MLKFPDWIYHKLPSGSRFWICLWIIWFLTLWYLSSTDHAPKNGPDIPHLDKVVHFCYFMAGGFCMANFMHLKSLFSWRKLIYISLIIGSTVGLIDEFHQSFTEGRNGNDLGDWIADTLGTLAGSLYCYFMWKRFTSPRSTV